MHDQILCTILVELGSILVENVDKKGGQPYQVQFRYMAARSAVCEARKHLLQFQCLKFLQYSEPALGAIHQLQYVLVPLIFPICKIIS